MRSEDQGGKREQYGYKPRQMRGVAVELLQSERPSELREHVGQCNHIRPQPRRRRKELHHKPLYRT